MNISWFAFSDIIIILFLLFILIYFRRFEKRTSTSESLANILVDSSALIDGRIVEVAESGFIFGKFLIPEFILKELHKVADSADSTKRTKGRMGLKNLRNLQKIESLDTEIISEDFPESSYVDEKLVKLAKLKNSAIVTVDFNLNRVAEIQNIKVLNLNNLANTLKPLFVPGEKLEIKIVQQGKEGSQGIGYLDDGTMVVVEDGMKFFQQKINCVVSRILQTDAGRMVFARPEHYGMDRIGGDRYQQSRRFSRFIPWQFRRKNQFQNNYNNNHKNHNPSNQNHS